ncbi:hypothetical protein [Luteipulveratus flavus]|uniref:Uncharacterized protein n=1 Tax=Luteipulveratus flavus TaxID=3031728 RepID=A0ABT6C3N5_9MICO|nr:hypothetical protein [Luteipulveratus sp. YIM 133296]MDF8263568.1 hypothetical protein [Luteipulveratus sp. YIM 133296]
MRSAPVRGAVIGLAVGCGLIGLLILLPCAIQGDFYEVIDALVAMGIPLVLISVVTGALLGSRPRGHGQPR